MCEVVIVWGGGGAVVGMGVLVSAAISNASGVFWRCRSVPRAVPMVSCRNLDLSQNQFSAIPSVFSGLSSLTYLSLALNSLQVVPDSISGLPSLLSLVLSRNRITSLPTSIVGLGFLTALDLSSNLITLLPSNFVGLSSLMYGAPLHVLSLVSLDLHGSQYTS
jgi:hypothetical protein